MKDIWNGYIIEVDSRLESSKFYIHKQTRQTIVKYGYGTETWYMVKEVTSKGEENYYNFDNLFDNKRAIRSSRANIIPFDDFTRESLETFYTNNGELVLDKNIIFISGKLVYLNISKGDVRDIKLNKIGI